MDGTHTVTEARLIEKVAAAMFESPHPDDVEDTADTWPPNHPDDRAWWINLATVAVYEINAKNCTAWFHGQPGCICQPIQEADEAAS